MNKKGLFLLILFSLTLVSCSAERDEIEEKNVFMFYSGENAIGYGTQKSDIENILGLPQAEEQCEIRLQEPTFNYIDIEYSYGSLSVIYQEDKAINIFITNSKDLVPSDFDWKTAQGIGIGSSREALEKAYEFSFYEDDSPLASISLKSEQNKLVKCGKSEQEYVLAFGIDRNNEVSSIKFVGFKDMKAIAESAQNELPQSP